MSRRVTTSKTEKKKDDIGNFDPFLLISNEEFCKNLNAIIAYYQMSKGEPKKRFVCNCPHFEN